MNNIYKVIWSKAKNCYVVASEIARSHTKSATGSGKIGGVTRRSLLASLMALSLLCGGLGVVSASLEVVDQSGTPGTVTIYTKDEVDHALTAKGAATDVAKNTADIAANKDNINKLETNKLDKGVANSTFATKDALNDLTTTVSGKADEAAVTTALDSKADTDLSNLTAAGETKIKDTMSADMDLKANKADVNTALDGKADKATVTDLATKVGDASSGLVKDVADLKTQGNDLNTAIGNKADQSALVAATDRITTNETNITALQTKTTGLSADGKSLNSMNRVETDALKVTGEISNGAGVTTTLTDIKASMDKANANETAIGQLQTTTTNQQTAIDGLNKKTTKITYDASNGTSVDGVTFNAGAVTGVTSINGTVIGTKESGEYIHQDNSIWRNMKNVDTQVKTNADAIGDNTTAITALESKVGTVNTGTYLDPTKSVGENLGLLDAGLKQETADRKAAIGELAVNGNYIEKDKNVSDNLVKLDNQAKANADEIVKTNERTGGIKRNTEKTQTTIEDSVKVDKQGNVKDVNELSAKTITTTGNADLKGNVTLGTTAANTVTVNGTADFNEAVNMDKGLTVTNGETNLKKTTVDGNLKVTGTITTDKMVFGDKPTNYTEIDHGKVTSKNLEVNGAGQAISSSSIFNAEENKVGFANNATGDQSFHKQTSDIIMDNVKDRDNSNYRTQTKTETKDIIKDKDGNSSTTSQTASENQTYLKDKDGKNTNSTIDTAKGYDKTIKGENGETSTKQDELNITNTAQNGTITNDAQNIVNNASGNITNKANTMDTNVTGKATESYGSLDTTVNGNETHIVKGAKTETVDGKVTENYGNGQETNVTGDQTTNVSGTQTTTATDINRNASSSMVDKVDNAYGTNTETKVAGKTTTDVSIKGTGEKGQYIRGANESRDYLIKGTLKNSETKTAEVTSTEITDGTNKASTIQDAKNLAGSVTNGTETGISGIHANDDGSVSIDSAVAGGGMSSVINQKKGSIQSTVVDGTSSTVILQDKDNVTIASSNGMVGIVGKDIVNNAQNTITNTAGTKITDKVGTNTRVTTSTSITDSVGATTNRKIEDGKITDTAGDFTVTTEKTKGTTFAKTGSTTAFSTEAGAPTDTNIAGNLITTGRVDANELGVSDKDGTNTADLSVKAGEGVKASAGNGTTTGSLDVKADEVSSSVKDASGKGSTFKQRIDKIMMESKDVSIKAEETLTNEAKVITNKASEVINNEAVNINNTATGIITSKASEIKNQADKLISNKVGENTWENMENGKITTSIKDGAKQNLTQSDAAGTTQSTVDGGKSTVTIQNADGLVGVVTDGRTTSVQNQTASQIAAAVKDGAGNENASVANATTSANTIKSGSKANTVISTADGTSFINSEAAAPVGDGTAVNTTIKGNTITTGKVTMDYAEVMKDLGVHGNAKVDQNLEVGGTSTLKGDVTMESNATVKKDLKVEGTTTTKTLKVTENAEIDGTLKVTKKATFEDSVSIAKDLSVGGDVTAKSYKVGDKTYIDANGINANDQKITNVADGSISEGSKDAVNGGQLYGVKRDLEHQVDKVGANAAAMANLRPMEFDPSSKWNIAAAIGNYGSETAAALGAFYRPNDNVMVNLSTAFGTGENMVGGGVSVRLGKGGNKLSREETNALKAQVADLTARMDALLSVLNPNMSKDFPDVPENHWAYEAVSRLAGNDIVQGYPDGEFHGERTMTRYEMAEIIYNALSRGAEAEKELVEEFKPELQAMAASEKATAEKAEG